VLPRFNWLSIRIWPPSTSAHATLFGGLKQAMEHLQMIGRYTTAVVRDHHDDFTSIGLANANIGSPVAFGHALDGGSIGYW
jgi:hypothetical protein